MIPPPDAHVADGYWTLPCEECGGSGRWAISTVRGLRRMRSRRWWRWPRDAATALRRRPCVACKATGRTIAVLARPRG